jgi:hypothetical protein
MLMANDTLPVASEAPPEPTTPTIDTPGDLTHADAVEAAQEAADELFDELTGRLRTDSWIAKQALDQLVDRLDPGGEVTPELVARVPALYSGDLPTSTDTIVSPLAVHIRRLQAGIDTAIDTFTAIDLQAREAAIAQELPRERAALKPTEKVSELDIRERAARAVDRRETERRRGLAQDQTEALTRHLEAMPTAHRTLVEARRSVPVPVPALTADETKDLDGARGLLGASERLQAALLLEQRKTQSLLGELLAVQAVPESTHPDALLELMADEDASPYARRRADALFARQVSRLYRERLLDRDNRARIDRYFAIREARVPEPVRRAEQAEYRQLALLEAQASRVRRTLAAWTASGVVGTFSPGQVAEDRAARQRAQAEATAHWRPIVTALRKARG